MKATIARQFSVPLVLHAATAEDLMVPNPISIRAEAEVTEALRLFTERGIAAAPVIDEAGRPIGVISRSDLLIHQCEHARPSASKPDYFFAGQSNAMEENGPRDCGAQTVADMMTPAVFAVSPETPVHGVLHEMVGLHVHRLFVVDDNGILVGVISTMDVLKQLRPE
jgi:CBS domain-containing protein